MISGDDFYHHPTYANGATLDWLYLLNGKIHVNNAPKVASETRFSCKILDKISENFNLTIAEIDGPIRWQADCFLPNLNNFLSNNNYLMHREEGYVRLTLYDNINQGERKFWITFLLFLFCNFVCNFMARIF